jgi:hypothetical protein
MILFVLLVNGCSDYLDVVPEGTSTMETTFSNRTNAEKFFYTCYWYLPNFANGMNYPGIFGGDDIWWDIDAGPFRATNAWGCLIAQGQQNVTGPSQNYWDGTNGGSNLWIAIRDCNIFLENIDQVLDMPDWEKSRWKAEVKFLKAFYHFFLMQLYGPIPIMDRNIPVNATPEEVRVYREPVDDVIEYIVKTLDEACVDLPLQTQEMSSEAGRATQAIATALKAKVLIWAASPLFNGSFGPYQDFKDKRGVQLISNDNSASAIQARWERAATAVKNAIDTAELAGHSLYEFIPSFEISAVSDTTALKYTIRGAVSERLTINREIIWGSNHGNGQLQNWCTPIFYSSYGGTSELSGTMKMAETFYTRNGIPIDEDPFWDYEGRYETIVNVDEDIVDDDGVPVPGIASWHKFYLGEGETTAKLHYYREPRFYANLGCDRGIYELYSIPETAPIVIKNRSGETHGYRYLDCHLSTGYFIKKMVSLRIPTTTSAPQPVRFSIPIIRLADLYLLYAEALNEIKEKPDPEVYRWIDIVRQRAGLDGVERSWAFSNNPAKPTTKEGMREIIKRERLIELAFEGQRSYDLRRWCDAEKYFNEPVRGWDYQGGKLEEYYQTRVYFNNRRFTYKDYLWPLRANTITVNSNLVQNPGW